MAQLLRSEIAAGTWLNRLPGERVLAARFQVSRRTLRAALAELRADGTLDTRASHASLISGDEVAVNSAEERRVVLLLPQPLEMTRPFTMLWVNHLTALLQDTQLRLVVMPGPKFYRVRPARSLTLLTDTQPARCWILARSHRPLQEWFSAAKIPALVCGSAHSGVTLPSVDIDHRAECRHAAGYFRRFGHRDLALFLDKAGLAGDAESEKGFREGLASADGDLHARVTTVRCDRTVTSIRRALRMLLSLPAPPTALLVSNSYTYLTVQSLLAAEGRRVPQDISIISRDEEPFLPFLHPNPTRYSARPARFASALYRALKHVIAGGGKGLTTRIMPEFVAGESVAAPPR